MKRTLLLLHVSASALATFDLPLTRRVLTSSDGSSSSRLLDTIDTDIDTIGEQIAFTTQMYFGSASQPMEMLVDTGSSVSSSIVV
jgi:hypothetical protein